MKPMLLVLFAVLVAPAYAQVNLSSFELNGDIRGMQGDPVTVYYRYTVSGKTIEDSAKVTDGKFRITGKIAEPVIAGLQVHYADAAFKAQPEFNRDYLFVYLDKGRISITGKDKFSGATVEGSAVHNEYMNFNRREATYVKARNELYMQLQEMTAANKQSAADSIHRDIEKLTNQLEQDLYMKFVLENSNSPIVFDVMNRLAGWKMDVEKIQPLYEKISSAQKNTWAGKDFRGRLEAAVRTKVGARAPAFQQPDSSGKVIALASLKGRFVLLDFWASWCLPCRQENPFLVEAYKKYKPKGFEIVSVSLDQQGQREAWVKAMKQDSMSWINVSDLKAFSSSIAKTYGIVAIPRNFLIDPQGVIIATDLRGKELEKQLAALLDKRS
jgi:thiol-disulfide isomerase/thioredoxin